MRIWDLQNNLIKELCFDDDVEGICFANDRADLLIAIKGEKFLVIQFLPQ